MLICPTDTLPHAQLMSVRSHKRPLRPSIITNIKSNVYKLKELLSPMFPQLAEADNIHSHSAQLMRGEQSCSLQLWQLSSNITCWFHPGFASTLTEQDSWFSNAIRSVRAQTLYADYKYTNFTTDSWIFLLLFLATQWQTSMQFKTMFIAVCSQETILLKVASPQRWLTFIQRKGDFVCVETWFANLCWRV